MPSPPVRSGTRSLGTLFGVIALSPLPVAAQRPPDFVPTTGFSMTVDAVIGGIVTLLIGGGLIALAPEFTERSTDRVLEDPGETFLYGLGIFIAALVVVFLLAITIVGIVLVVPLVIALVVGGEIGYLAAGRAVVDDLGPALLVAIVLSAFASGVPWVGGLVGFVVASTGTGAWYLDYRDDGSSAGGSPGIDPVSGEPAGSAHTGETGDGTRDAGDGTPDADDESGDAWTAGFDDGPEGN